MKTLDGLSNSVLLLQDKQYITIYFSLSKQHCFILFLSVDLKKIEHKLNHHQQIGLK